MTHRLLHEDEGLHCFACGAFFSGDQAEETAALVDCTGPETEHPGYYLGVVDGVPVRETCAAHPYADETAEPVEPEPVDYSKSKYQDALTEQAYGIAGEGFADETAGDLSEGRDWCALVTVDGRHVIIREDSQGFVWTDWAEEQHDPSLRLCVPRRRWADYLETDREAEDCEYGATSIDECRMMRERSVAGLSNDIPSCSYHGDYPADTE